MERATSRCLLPGLRVRLVLPDHKVLKELLGQLEQPALQDRPEQQERKGLRDRQDRKAQQEQWLLLSPAPR